MFKKKLNRNVFQRIHGLPSPAHSPSHDTGLAPLCICLVTPDEGHRTLELQEIHKFILGTFCEIFKKVHWMLGLVLLDTH